jgi:hypothetical protein
LFIERGTKQKLAEEIKIRNIRQEFNNQLIIIDDIHHLRNSKDNPIPIYSECGKNLLEMVQHAENTRLLLLSATPIYNSPEDIFWITNLMNSNDGRQLIDPTLQLFDQPSSPTLIRRTQRALQSKLKVYVSYVRGANPYTFPYQIYLQKFIQQPSSVYSIPTKSIVNGKEIEENEQFTQFRANIYAYDMNPEQETGYNELFKESFGKYKKPLSPELLQTQQELMTIVYPMDDENNKQYLFGENGIQETMEFDFDKNQRCNYRYKTNTMPFFSKDILPTCGLKLAKICDLVVNGEGICLIYTHSVETGAIPMALALEEWGLKKFNGKSLMANKKSMATITANAEENSNQQYIIISVNSSISPNNVMELKTFNSEENKNGEEIKVIILVSGAEEGMELKCVRQIHFLESTDNMNSMERIISHGVGHLSHCRLPFEKRNVEIYLHCLLLPGEKKVETIDWFLYRTGERKAIQIGKITRFLKECAVDCHLNIGQTNFTVEKLSTLPANQSIPQTSSSEPNITIMYNVGDENGSSICDYQVCYQGPPSALVNEEEEEEEEEINLVVPNNKVYLPLNPVHEIPNYTFIFQKIESIMNSQPKIGEDNLLEMIQKNSSFEKEEILSALTYLTSHKNEYLTNTNGEVGNLVHYPNYFVFESHSVPKNPAEYILQGSKIENRIRVVKFQPLNKTIFITSPKLKEPRIELIKRIMSHIDIVFGKKKSSGQEDEKWYERANQVKNQFDLFLSEKEWKQIIIDHDLDELSLDEKLILINSINKNTFFAESISDYLAENCVTTTNDKRVCLMLSSDIIVYDENNKTWIKIDDGFRNILLEDIPKSTHKTVYGVMKYDDVVKRNVFWVNNTANNITQLYDINEKECLRILEYLSVTIPKNDPWNRWRPFMTNIMTNKNPVLVEILLRSFQKMIKYDWGNKSKSKWILNLHDLDEAMILGESNSSSSIDVVPKESISTFSSKKKR